MDNKHAEIAVNDDALPPVSLVGAASELTQGDFGSNGETHTTTYKTTRTPRGPKRFTE